MTDNEIIKALECCIGHEDCATCPQHSSDCVEELFKLALDLINRQQADKEALIAGQETLQKYIAEQQAEIEELKKLLTEEEAKYTKCAKRFYKEGIKDFKHTVRTYFRLTFLRRKLYEKIFDEVESDLLKEMVGDAE